MLLAALCATGIAAVRPTTMKSTFERTNSSVKKLTHTAKNAPKVVSSKWLDRTAAKKANAPNLARPRHRASDQGLRAPHCPLPDGEQSQPFKRGSLRDGQCPLWVKKT
jgi:hypothetical protein